MSDMATEKTSDMTSGRPIDECRDKPSYIGLLNAIALGETRAAKYLNCWADVTPNPAVRALVHSIALREAEHGLAFEKRLDELGYGLIDKPDSGQEKRMAIASSTSLSDREKLEQLGFARPPQNGHSDIFDRFFDNKDLDPVTGGLLGRYIAEERDTGRRLSACHCALSEAEACAAEQASAQTVRAPMIPCDTADLAAQIDAAGRHLADLVRSIGSVAAPA